MIYLIDSQLTNSSHSSSTLKIISDFTKEKTKLYEVTPDNSNVISILDELIDSVSSTDIVVCPWVIPKYELVDQLFSLLSEKCFVVCAAGNCSDDIKNWTPASNPTVITVGCLNKSGKRATLSNYSNTKKLEWVVGTNYMVDKLESGTSVSVAIYAAFLAEAIIQNDFLVIEKMNNEHSARMLKELD
jgi:hypothetical protein